MNAVVDYTDLDMGGLTAAFYGDVPAEAQARLIAAFPELRLLWNAKLKLYQCVHRQPGWREGFYVGTGFALLSGWSIIPGNYEPPLAIDAVIAQLRAREAVAIEKCKERGFDNISDLVDHLYDEIVENNKKAESSKMDELLGLRPDGTVSPFGLASGAEKSKPYAWRGIGRPDSALPRSPEWLAQHAVPVARGPGKKELARREKRLREGIR